MHTQQEIRSAVLPSDRKPSSLKLVFYIEARNIGRPVFFRLGFLLFIDSFLLLGLFLLVAAGVKKAGKSAYLRI